jgi:hypothetical protein
VQRTLAVAAVPDAKALARLQSQIAGVARQVAQEQAADENASLDDSLVMPLE